MERMTYLRDVVTLALDAGKCNGCGMCLEVCPHSVLARAEKRVRIDERDACMECGACAMNCPTGALQVQSGVGCAAAVLIGKATGRPVCCGPGTDPGAEEILVEGRLPPSPPPCC